MRLIDADALLESFNRKTDVPCDEHDSKDVQVQHDPECCAKGSGWMLMMLKICAVIGVAIATAVRIYRDIVGGEEDEAD